MCPGYRSVHNIPKASSLASQGQWQEGSEFCERSTLIQAEFAQSHVTNLLLSIPSRGFDGLVRYRLKVAPLIESLTWPITQVIPSLPESSVIGLLSSRANRANYKQSISELISTGILCI